MPRLFNARQRAVAVLELLAGAAGARLVAPHFAIATNESALRVGWGERLLPRMTGGRTTGATLGASDTGRFIIRTGSWLATGEQ